MTSGMSQFTAHVISHASLNTTTSSLLYWINIPISPEYYKDPLQQVDHCVLPINYVNNYLNNNSMLRFKFQPVDHNHISQLIDKLKK